MPAHSMAAGLGAIIVTADSRGAGGPERTATGYECARRAADWVIRPWLPFPNELVDPIASRCIDLPS